MRLTKSAGEHLQNSNLSTLTASVSIFPGASALTCDDLTNASSLLAIGFGDAGAEVIANNIKSGGDIDPMVPGQKVTAIFGFCDIRQFTDTTEVLQVAVTAAPVGTGEQVKTLGESQLWPIVCMQ
jgi:hypothetical protein